MADCNNMRKKWTASEEDKLRQRYSEATPAELVSEFKTSYLAIKVKASKLGIKSKPPVTESDELLILQDHAVLGLNELLAKHALSSTTLYRILNKHNATSIRKTTRFNDQEFSSDYVTLTEVELTEKYKTSYTNLKAKASNLGIRRPLKLQHRRATKFDLAELKTDYLTNKLTSNEIAAKHGCPNSGSWIRSLLKRNGISKSRQEITRQKMTTRARRHGSFKGGKYGKAQKEVQDWLASHGLTFTPDHSMLDGKEIDLYNSDLRVGIEYCGLYWHNENSPTPRTQEYHHDKYQKCKNLGVKLITIFEDEWLHRKEQVKGALLSILQLNSIKVHGRKCTVMDIKKSEAYAFYRSFHIQGAPRQGTHFAGLYYEKELVGAMSFGKHHRDSSKTVLDRLCFKSGVSVAGGSSKLFKHLLKTSGITTLSSWSDHRWFCGSVYSKLGFKLAKTTKPDYSYVDTGRPGTRRSKQSQKKNATKCPEDLTEVEWAASRGLFRIWDCGKSLWAYGRNEIAALPALP